MKPAWFDYYAPRSLDEALHILADAGPNGRVLAGGQSLMPMLNCRLLNPDILVDINRIEALNGLDVTKDSLTVGALVRHADLLHDGRVREGWPLLFEATKQVAHPAIRNRGTVCGSVAHNDPAAEHPSVLVTLDGTVVIAGAAGRRELPAEEFFTGILSTALKPGEMVVAVRYPRSPAGTGTAICGIRAPPWRFRAGRRRRDPDDARRHLRTRPADHRRHGRGSVPRACRGRHAHGAAPWRR